MSVVGNHNFKIGQGFFWTDSQTVVQWINELGSEIIAINNLLHFESQKSLQFRRRANGTGCWLPIKLKVAHEATRVLIFMLRFNTKKSVDYLVRLSNFSLYINKIIVISFQYELAKSERDIYLSTEQNEKLKLEQLQSKHSEVVEKLCSRKR